MDSDAPVAFAVRQSSSPAFAIRVNFGILAGREATAAEIDQLGQSLLAIVADVTIVGENHHEIGQEGEGVVHLVNIALDSPPDAQVERQLVDAATVWARACAAERNSAV